MLTGSGFRSLAGGAVVALRSLLAGWAWRGRGFRLWGLAGLPCVPRVGVIGSGHV